MNDTLKLAIFTHSDNLSMETYVELQDMTRKSPGVVQVTLEKIEGILRLYIYYEDNPSGVHALAGTLQDPKGIFSEERPPEEVEIKLGPTGKLIERTKRGFRMLINTKLEDVLKIQARGQEFVDVTQLTPTEIKRWEKAEKTRAGLQNCEILCLDEIYGGGSTKAA